MAKAKFVKSGGAKEEGDPGSDWQSVKLLAKSKIKELVYRRYTNNQAIKQMEEENKAQGEEIEFLLMKAGVEKIRVDDLVCFRAKGKSQKRISDKLLLEEGVDPEVIQRATIEGTPYTYVQVKKTGGKDDE